MNEASRAVSQSHTYIRGAPFLDVVIKETTQHKTREHWYDLVRAAHVAMYFAAYFAAHQRQACGFVRAYVCQLKSLTGADTVCKSRNPHSSPRWSSSPSWRPPDMVSAEITVSPNTPMPKGYKLLRKGYPFVTALCRRKTLAAGQTLYVVRAGSRTQGLRAPRHIINECYKEEERTRATRRATVAARDTSARSLFETALRLQFPEMPAVDVEQVLQRTLKKRSGRVGRTSKLGTKDKVRLAVTAHARHMHTDYDKLVRGETSREDARKMVHGSVRSVLARWEGSREKPSASRGQDSRRRRPHTRAMTRKASEQSLGSLGGEEDLTETTTSSLDDPILISSGSEDDSVDVLVISSDEE